VPFIAIRFGARASFQLQIPTRSLWNVRKLFSILIAAVVILFVPWQSHLITTKSIAVSAIAVESVTQRRGASRRPKKNAPPTRPGGRRLHNMRLKLHGGVPVLDGRGKFREPAFYVKGAPRTASMHTEHRTVSMTINLTTHVGSTPSGPNPPAIPRSAGLTG